MSLWDALRMNMMISYQELVRTFLNNELRNFYLRNNATLYEVYHEVKNVNKGVGLVGDNGIVLVIRSSNSKNTLEEFHEFFGNFKPNNSTARVEVIDQSVLEPFWRF